MVYYRMQKIIEVRFGSDNLLKEEEQLSCIRYLNRILSVLKEDIISNKGHVDVNFKKGTIPSMTFMSVDSDLNKRVNLKLCNMPPFPY